MNMVERVARAICDAEGIPSKEGQDFAWRTFERAAKAAIAAMREPNNRMLKAAGGCLSPGKRPTPEHVSSKEKHRIRYRSMIDAALPSEEQAA